MDSGRTHGVTARPAVRVSSRSSGIVYGGDVGDSKATLSAFFPTGRFVANMTGRPCFDAPCLPEDAAGAFVETVRLFLRNRDFMGIGVGVIVISGIGAQLSDSVCSVLDV
jgi:hypothetical protein